MPTLKKYGGIKACEDFVQRCTSYGSSSDEFAVKPFKSTDGTSITKFNSSAYSAAINNRYLNCGTIKASADDYDATDYNGTSTGACTFSCNVSQSGVSYTVSFTASASATIKCFKFFKGLQVVASAYLNKETLMFAIYFDEPISVTSGQILNMSINFAYDEEQVTII